MRQINAEGLALLKEFEAFAEVRGDPNVAWAYWDKIGKVWTGPWGFTNGVAEGDSWTRAAADAQLLEDLIPYEEVVERSCVVTPNENQFAAMVVLCWNIGPGWDPSKPKPPGAKDGFRQSTVLKAHNRRDFESAARAFGLWDKSGGKVIAGLTRRRAAEKTLYLKPKNQPGGAEPTPQVVDGESSLAKSPIVQGTTLAGGTATIVTISQGAQAVKDIQESLGDMLPYVIIACAIGVSVFGLYYRFKQRRGGWV